MDKYLELIEADLAVYRTHPIRTAAAIAIFDKTVAKYETILTNLRARLGCHADGAGAATGVR